MKWTLRLIGINFLVFLLELLFPEFFIKYFAFIPKLALLRPWTFLTSIFLHADISHLFFNMLALFFFGGYLENLIGSKKFLTIYFLAGLLGNIAYLLWDPVSTIPGLGASGAIYGIIGALTVLRPFMIIYINFMPVPLIVAAFFWLIINLVGLFNPYSNIGYHAHLAGLLLGFYYGYKLKKERKKYSFEEIYFEDYF